MKPKISVIVPNYEGKDVFPDCIDSLLKQNYPNLQIVLVDDSSTDGSYELAKKMFGNKITLTQTKVNSGYVGACNKGLTKCTGSYIIVTNNDTTVPKHWVSEMYRPVEGKKKIIGGSTIKATTKDLQIQKIIDGGRFGAFTLVGSMVFRTLTPEEKRSGFIEIHAVGSFIVPRDALSSYIFRKSYFAYGEDVELCWRLRLQGYHIVVNRKAWMTHVGSYTRKHVPAFNKKASFHGTKNQLQNAIVFYEKKNIVKIFPWIIIMQIGRGLVRPSHWPQYVKAYWWLLTHMSEVLRHRKKIQKMRKIDDNDIFRLVSYRLHEILIKSWKSRIVNFANNIMHLYCKIVGLRTFDIDDDNASPNIHIPSVTDKVKHT